MPYLLQDPKKVVRPLGSWGESRIHTDKRVVAKGSLVNVVKRADFLVSRVFPREDRREKAVTKALIRVYFNANDGDRLPFRGPQSICINKQGKHVMLTDNANCGVLSYRK